MNTEKLTTIDLTGTKYIIEVKITCTYRIFNEYEDFDDSCMYREESPFYWTIEADQERYNLVLSDRKVSLDVICSDKNILSLRDTESFPSGFRIFTFFKNKNLFSISETGYYEVTEKQKKLYVPGFTYSRNRVVVMNGSYTIEY